MEEIIDILEEEKEKIAGYINNKIESVIQQYPSMSGKLTTVGLDMSAYASAIRKLFQGIEVSFIEIGYESLPKFIVDAIAMAVNAVEEAKNYTTYENTKYQECAIVPKFDWYSNIDGNFTLAFKNMNYLLYCPNINITKSSTTIRNVFLGCEFLKRIEGIDAPVITDMLNAFANCKRLKKVHITSDLSNCTQLGGVFGRCEKLEDTNISSWNIDGSKVLQMHEMFDSCESLPSATIRTVEGWSLSNFTNCARMFRDTLIDTIDLQAWDSSKCTDFTSMFANCANLSEVDITGWVFKNNCSVGSMFYNCTSLTSFDFSSIAFESVSDATSMFYGCSGLTSLDISSIDTSGINISAFILGCFNLTTVTGTFDFSSTTSLTNQFNSCKKLTRIKVANTQNATKMNSAFVTCLALVTIEGDIDMSSCTDAGNMFSNCSALKDVSLKNIKTSLSLVHSTTLSYASILGIVSNLDDTVTTPMTLTLSSGAMALLTQTQKSNIESIIDELGKWNVVY